MYNIRKTRAITLYIILQVFLVPCSDVRYDVSIKTMFRSSLHLVVYRSAHVLFTLFVDVCV